MAAQPSLRGTEWPRFLKAPDGQLVARLYEPGLRAAVRYERCCAYFSSSVLAAAASGFGAIIARIVSGHITQKPALRLIVNEELAEADVDALLHSNQDAPLIAVLLDRFGDPVNALQRRRLEMLAWLVRDGWLEVKVGVMRLGGGILHAKFGLFTDAAQEAVIFAGSGNESANGVRGNYEQLEISESWRDAERYKHFRRSFDDLWDGRDPAVKTVALPQAVAEKLIKFAPPDPPLTEAEDDVQRRRAAMLWGYALASPFMPDGGEATCDAMAPVTLWPHQHRVVTEVAAAWPDGRLLCDEVGMGKTVEAILAIRRLLAGRGVRRVLFLPPANLLPQWQGELREKGGLVVPRLDGPTLIWPDGRRQPVSGLAEALEQDRLLVSRELVRLEVNVPDLLAARPWDLVLLDEGHAARRSNQREGEFNNATLLLTLLRQLQATSQARGIMILSATPMQTHPWEPWDLLQALGEGGLFLSGFHIVRRFYEAVARLKHAALTKAEAMALADILVATPDKPQPPAMLGLPDPADAVAFADVLCFLPQDAREQAAQWLRTCSPLSRRMRRNTRATLRRYFELGLLDKAPAKRDVREDPFDFDSQEERDVYDEVTRYIDKRYDELEHQKPGKGFVMTIYRRRAASSPMALRRSLERRALGLRAVIAQRAYDDTVPDVDDAQELEELLNIKLTAGLPESPADAANELGRVQDLLARIDALGGLDTKRDHLIAWVRQLTGDGRSVLVFTGYTDTMAYLRDALRSALGAGVASYSGQGGAFWQSGAWVAATKEDVTAALRAGSIRVLVCTDAASEGLNLQAAGALINSDLPWNPSKVEQRIGRIDRIGQALDVLPIVNLYLKGSIDQRVYRALHLRCHLFEQFVGPMQPVLSRALRMLMGRDQFDENALADIAGKIQSDPTVLEIFGDDDAVVVNQEPPLVQPADTETLLAALDGTGVSVRAETNSRHVIGDGPLRIVTDLSAVADDLDAACIDGLDPRQWALLRQLQRPGERLPLILVSAEEGAFHVQVCAWVAAHEISDVHSFAQLKSLVATWDGSAPPTETWISAYALLEKRAWELVHSRAVRAASAVQRVHAAQVEAARLRLIEELGRTLVCFDPVTDDLNGKFHRLATENTPTANRLARVFQRLGGYPAWTDRHVSDLRAYRDELGAAQLNARRTGRELDAALDDPRWTITA